MGKIKRLMGSNEKSKENGDSEKHKVEGDKSIKNINGENDKII